MPHWTDKRVLGKAQTQVPLRGNIVFIKFMCRPMERDVVALQAKLQKPLCAAGSEDQQS